MAKRDRADRFGWQPGDLEVEPDDDRPMDRFGWRSGDLQVEPEETTSKQRTTVVKAVIPVRMGAVLGDLTVDVAYQCTVCENWTEGLSCRAFPRGIPLAIRRGEHDHLEPYSGDGGVRFQHI